MAPEFVEKFTDTVCEQMEIDIALCRMTVSNHFTIVM
jgi:hypothetical protein